MITDLVLNGTELTCYSTGRPVAVVTWLNDGQEINVVGENATFSLRQIVDDSSNASYRHILSSQEEGDFAGTFTCKLVDFEGNIATRNLNFSGTVGSYSEIQTTNGE